MISFLDRLDLNAEKHAKKLLWIILAFSLILILFVQYPSLVDDHKVQDDARQHLYWMAGFHDSELFENDFITELQTRRLGLDGFLFIYDYKNIGFSILYYIASFAVTPVFFNKILPFFLVLISVYFAFRTGKMLAGTTSGFLLAFTFLVFNLNPSGFSISQGFQRSFAYPLLFTFLYLLIGRRYVKAAVVTIAGLLIYPMITLVIVMAYALSVFRDMWKTETKTRLFKRAVVPLMTVILAGILLSCGIFLEAARGPSRQFAIADDYYRESSHNSLRNDPALGPNGRFHVFSDGSILGVPTYLIVGPGGLFTRSAWGFMGRNIVPLFLLSIFILVIAGFSSLKLRKEIWYILLSCLFMFAVSWIAALWFKRFIIFFPSRYTSTTIPFFLLLFVSVNLELCVKKLSSGKKSLLLISMGVVMIILALLLHPALLRVTFSTDGVFEETTLRAIQLVRSILFVIGVVITLCGVSIAALSKTRDLRKHPVAVRNIFAILLLIVFGIVYLPGVSDVGVISPSPDELELYRFISTLPKDIYLAGHPADLDDIPIYAKRKVFDNSEFSVVGERIIDLFAAYYSTEAAELCNFCSRYGVDCWLVNRARFAQRYLSDERIYFDPYNDFVVDKVKGEKDFILNGIPKDKILFERGNIFIIGTDAICANSTSAGTER